MAPSAFSAAARPAPRARAARAAAWATAIVLGLAAGAGAGHELPFYPSYYPQEIKVETLRPAAAAGELTKSTLHAYVGADPFAGGRLPANVSAVESLAAHLVLSFNPTSPAMRTREARCGAAARLGQALPPGGWVAHPYPVTPLHADYLQHHDLVLLARHRAQEKGDALPLRLRARGPLAQRLVKARDSGDWDAVLEEVEPPGLVARPAAVINGWLGPPWVREGWFAAWALQSAAMTEPASRQAAETLHHRLATGAIADLAERMDAERQLVRALGAGCERVVLGYRLRREPFSVEFSQGIENVGADALTGLNSAIFVRTAKLKDFPWNGWLRLGVDARPAAAWNPLGGFTDAAGRLLWWALGDPALLPAPRGAGWMANRATPVQTDAPPGGLEIPADAVAPEAGTGLLKDVGAGKTARARVTYRITSSLFHDGTRMTAADALYPYSVAARWSGKGGKTYDPLIDAATAPVRDRLAAVRVVRVDSEVRRYADVTFTYVMPVIDVYLTRPAADPSEAAASAPPWSAVPWHVVALMEEAVVRGLAAFSREEAQRRGLPWLDLARDPRLRRELEKIARELGASGYVPPALAGLVAADEAQHRWASLQQFARRRGHYLVTNGPYQLEKWADDVTTLAVFRDFTYPLGVGSYDRYAIPLRAYPSRAVVRGDRVEVHADVEEAQKFLRDHRIVREPLQGRPAPQDRRELPVCRYVVVAADGSVAGAGTAPEPSHGAFTLSFRGRLRPGAYTVLVALAVRDNLVDPEVATVQYRLDPAP